MKANSLLVLCLCVLLAPSGGQAASLTWDGTGNNNANWTTKQNWAGNAIIQPGDELVFAGLNRPVNVNDTPAGTTYTGIAFSSGAAAFTLTGNSITLGGGIVNNSSNLQTIQLAMNLPANRTINAASGSLFLSGNLTGAGGLEKSGANILTLTGPNAYAGPTAVNAGTLVVNGNQAAATGLVTVAAGATLAGTGTVGGATTVAGTHSPGAPANGIGAQSFASGLTCATTSIFGWDVSPAGADSVTAASLSITSGAVFKVLEQGITDTFWNTARSWTVFGATTTGTFSLFGNDGGVFSSRRTIPGEGHFDLSHSAGGVAVSWTPVPELSSALVGCMLAVAIGRRQRSRGREP